ncbi:MAG: diguanylate cyclase [Chloroflexi bacterium]|nr:MAG: diguanylate cyclase [Chloroflexota bacterium]
MTHASADAEQMAAQSSPGTVLVVDDQESNRVLLRKFLTVDGYAVHEASNGEQALHLMREHSPDVVLLDLMMPDMSGYDVLRAKARDSSIAAIPVLMLTAVTQPSVKLEGLELGVSDYLTKPFSPPELRARVKNLVRLHWQEVELTKLNAELARQAASDSLTGLANRRGFDSYWAREISRSQRYNTSIALVMFDIDHFKAINDSYGHGVGDAVLTTISEMLSADLRQSDLLARIGGEEFALGLPNANEAAAALVAEKVRLLVSRRVIAPLTAPCTISAGVASSTSTPADRLVEAADAALYDAKRAGRNRVSLASAALAGGVLLA